MASSINIALDMARKSVESVSRAERVSREFIELQNIGGIERGLVEIMWFPNGVIMEFKGTLADIINWIYEKLVYIPKGMHRLKIHYRCSVCGVLVSATPSKALYTCGGSNCISEHMSQSHRQETEKEINIHCAECGNGFHIPPSWVARYSRPRSKPFCSPECKQKYVESHQVRVVCPQCGIEFVKKEGAGKYCSEQCKKNAKGDVKTCPQCGKEFYLPHWMIRNRQDPNRGYRPDRANFYCSKVCYTKSEDFKMQGRGKREPSDKVKAVRRYRKNQRMRRQINFIQSIGGSCTALEFISMSAPSGMMGSPGFPASVGILHTQFAQMVELGYLSVDKSLHRNTYTVTESGVAFAQKKNGEAGDGE